MKRAPPHRLRGTLAGCLCLAAALLPRHWLEASMLRHMLLQLPLLAAAGWLVAGRLSALRVVARIDEHGLCGLAVLLFASAYWMVPRALEQSLTLAPAELAKCASLLLCGALLPGALARANRIIQLFFLGNFCAMMAIAGMQYQNMPARLCNAYLLDDQTLAGMGLVIVALLIAVLWCAAQARSTAATVPAAAASPYK
jgi:hypothetical protein